MNRQNLGKSSALLAVALAGCATAPLSYVSTTPQPQATAFACAVRKINSLGYTVTNASKDAGFISAEKQTSGLGTTLLTGKKYQSAITVAVFDGDQGRTQLRVTAGQGEENAVGFGRGAGSKTTGKPSAQGIADAKAILSACGTGEIQEQTSSNIYVGDVLASD